MELFGRSPTHPTTGLEWLVLAGLLGVIVLSVLRAADLPAALLTSGAALAAYIFDRSFAIPFAVAVAGLAAFVFRKRTVHREPEQRALREGTVFVAIVALYALGSQVVHESWEIAQQNSIAIIDFEQTLRIGHELALQRWLLDHDRYLPLIDTAYSWLFLPFVGGTLAWLYLTQDRLYRQYRTALAISALLAVIVVALHPVAPPRSTSGSGLIGTHALVGGSDGMIGPFDAVPSLHVGWAALSGMALYFGVRSRLRWVWLIAPPVAMLFMAMATGEHYLVDCVVGLVIALIPFLTIQWVDRRLGGPYYFSLSLLSPRTIGRAL
ncbi:MAG: phosphatase PAP2 family protein, partial [Thermomicrobiales bacterium]|nr:phosphatase PAP2 family protein [Thermomicrobiales bacterium]